MKQLVLFLIAGAALSACTSATDKKEKESLAVARKYMEAVETNNLASMDSLLADNYMGYGPSVADSINKTDALANWKYNSEQLYESIQYTRHQNLAVTVKDHEEAEPGNWVSIWAYLTIKFRDGRGTANLWVNAAYKIDNGKIVRSRTFYNESDVLQQLGYGWVATKE
jgi:hypothetical protein